MMFWQRHRKTRMPTPTEALPGRREVMPVAGGHAVSGNPLVAPYPEHLAIAMFGLGCFWGAERIFWQVPGVWVTAVGYAAGYTSNPTYDEVCSGRTGHNEVVRVVYDPTQVSYAELVKIFFESHDPTQGMRQGNDVGTQYRSGVYWYTTAQRIAAEAATKSYAERLSAADFGAVTTEVLPAPEFYFAEDKHQQYLHKSPGGYCGIGGTGVSCPVGLAVPDATLS